MDLLLPRLLRRPPAFTDDHDAPLTPLLGVVEQEDGSWQPQQTVQQAFSKFKFADDEYSTSLAFFTLEQEEPRDARMTCIQWLDSVPTDEDPLAGFMQVGLEQEEPRDFRTTCIQWFDCPFSDDELVASASFYLEQEEPRDLRATCIQWIPRPFSDDEAGEPLVNQLEQYDGWTAQYESVQWLASPVLYDETTGVFALFVLDEGDVRTLVRSAVPWTVTLTIDEADCQLLKSAVEQEDGWNSAVSAVPWFDSPFIYEEVTGRFASFALEQEEPSVLRQSCVLLLCRPYLDDEASAGLAYFAREEEGTWIQRYCTAIQYSNYLPDSWEGHGPNWAVNPFLESEDNTLQLSWTTSSIWRFSAYSYDETGSPLANLGGADQEQPWQLGIQCVSWSQYATFREEDAGSQLLNFAREQEEPWVARTSSQAWYDCPYTYDEMGWPLAYFTLEYEDQWNTSRTLSRMNSPASTDDETASPLKLFSVDEELPYKAAQSSAPWSHALVQDEEASAGLFSFGLDQVDSWSWLTEEQYSPPTLSMYDEIGSGLLSFGIEQEDSWLDAETTVAWNDVVYVDEHALFRALPPLVTGFLDFDHVRRGLLDFDHFKRS